MVPWLTHSADNSRSGWNAKETPLTQASVITKGLIRLITIPVIGDMRGMEARPLILPQVKLPNGSTYDVMVLPSMANVVRGVDAVWSKNSCGMAVVLQYPAESLETAYWASGFLLANFL